MIQDSRCLIAAISGRALAASAARAGHRVVVLDCFADRDTLESAPGSRAVCRAAGPRLDHRALLRAAAELTPAGAGARVVYGSGFEARTGLLAQLAEGRTLIGNPPAIVAAVKDPTRFFPLLDRLGIPHPEVRLTPPLAPEGWLVKRTGGSGGTHVRAATRRSMGTAAYYQRLEPGRTLSVVFLANGREHRTLGCNEQWTAAHPALPFLYGGAVSHVPLPSLISARVEHAVRDLVAATGIVGLNGIDFLLHGERVSVLELNPRPTATMELYDPDWTAGLFDAHLRACAGVLPGTVPAAAASRAAAIVLASDQWICREEFRFPAWCRDLPHPGARVAAGQPVCTVHAEAATPEAARAAVMTRSSLLREALGAALVAP